MAPRADLKSKPSTRSLWKAASKSVKNIEPEQVAAVAKVAAPVAQTLFKSFRNSAGGSANSQTGGSSTRDLDKDDPAAKGASTTNTNSTTDEGSSRNFLVGILDAINVSKGDNKDEVEVNLSEQAPPIPSPAESFLRRFSSAGTASDDTPKVNDGDEEGSPRNSTTVKPKWTTESLRSSGVVVKTDRPSIYEESLEMIIAALLIYTFADLRKMVRDGKIQSKELMQHPIAISQVMDAIRTHRVALEEEARIDENDLEARMHALKDIQKSQQSSSSMIGRMLRGKSKKKETVLTHFHDEKSTNGMCYGVAVNHIRKRVTVIFRGSVTQQDFITDVNLAQKKVNNPVAKVAMCMETPTTINLHTGFYQYLFMKDESGRVRLEHILDDVKTLMKKNKGYRLYCTGHSLGGALSSLCGFYAACDPEITKNGTVVVVSIASPRVGNSDFRTAFQALERMQLLQHLRISNKEDLVSLVPFVALKEAKLSLSVISPTSHSVNLYKHCGIHLKFKSGGSNPEEPCDDERQLFSVTYAKDKNDEEGALPEELKRCVVAGKSLVGSLFATKLGADFKSVVRYHCCDEYERRLENSKSYLDTITLDHLYADQSLVGTVVARPAMEKESSSSSRSFFRTSKKRSSSSVKA